MSKRVIVDGIEFGELTRFPRILTAVTSSMQLPRLVIAVFIVAALVTGGRIWDGIFPDKVDPSGLVDEWTSEHEAAAQAFLRVVMQDPQLIPNSERPDGDPENWTRINPARTLAIVQRSYPHWREDHVELPDFDEREAAYLAQMRGIRDITPTGAFEASVQLVSASFTDIIQGGLRLDGDRMLGGLHGVFVDLPRGLWRKDRAFLFVYGLFFLIVTSVGGGALSRMAACQVALHQRIRVREAIEFGLGNWVHLVLTPIVPLVLILVACLIPTVIGGALMNIPFVEIIGAILYGVMLLVGAIIAIIALGYAASFPLLVPGVTCERCDPIDSMQRAYAYMMQRPLHLAGYLLVALVGLVIGTTVVFAVVSVTIETTAFLFGLLNKNSAVAVAGDAHFIHMVRPQLEIHAGTSTFASWLINFWEMLVVCVLPAYVVTYFWSSTTVVYLLMRKACDGQDVEEIWQPGLIAGTLAPMPRTVVKPAVVVDEDDDEASENGDDAEAADGDEASSDGEADSDGDVEKRSG